MTRRSWLLLCGALAACTDLGIVGRVCSPSGCDADGGGAMQSAREAGVPQPSAAPSADATLTASADGGSPALDAGTCDPATYGCTHCSQDVDCADNFFYPVCDLGSATCVECPDSAQETELRLRVIRNCLSLVAPACLLFPVDARNTACWTDTCGNRCAP